MTKQTVRDIDLKNKPVLVRVDYNVPLKDGVVGDPLRIQASFDTLNYLIEQGCSIVLMSHLGRPDGQVKPELSLAPVAKKVGELWGREVKFVSDCVGEPVAAAVQSLAAGEALLLENLRFHPEEEANDADFAKQLAAWGEIYVDDAFAAIHRVHASTVGVTAYLPSVAGLLVEKEVDYIQGSMENPQRPLAAVIGGAKVSTKIEVLNNLLPKVNILMIGGAMANTFFLAEGKPVGKSLAEPDFVETAKELVAKAQQGGVQLLLPGQVVISKSLEAAQDVRTVAPEEVAADDYIVDAAPAYAAELTATAPKTVLWNGPVGITEVADFAAGSRAVADAIVALGGTSVIGGGDTAAFVDESGLHDKFTWVSTGGGASLELMSGLELPGLAALRDKH